MFSSVRKGLRRHESKIINANLDHGEQKINRNKKGGTKLWLHHQETQVTCGI